MNVIVGQSGGPTAAINASLAGVYCGALKAGADKIYGMKNGIEGFLKEEFVLLKDVLKDENSVETLKRTPSSYLGSCRYKLKSEEKTPEVYQQIFDILEKYAIDCFFYIGGNDSMDTIAKLSAYGEKHGSKIRFVGIPKTIDNDLPITDHTPGYGSAAKFVATVLKEIICDSTVYDMQSITIVEIMGRNAGWLTAASALAKGEDCDGVDMIYLPEVAFDLDKFIQDVQKKQKTKGNLIVAVSEGIKIADGRYVCELADTAQEVDAFGHKRLTGTGQFLAYECTKRLGIKARAIELSTLQRCASHLASLTDINEAFAVGEGGVQAALEGKSGVAMTLLRLSDNPYTFGVGVGNIHEIANQEKNLPLEWYDKENLCMREAFLQYAKPLIKGELTPYFKDGLPTHLKR